jgi:hypothetical protein
MRWAHTLLAPDGTTDTLVQDVRLAVGADGDFHLIDDNDADLGREAVWVDGVLYTRHRYGRFLLRDDGEQAAPALRDEPWTTLRATLDLIGHGIDIAPRSGGLAIRRAEPPRPAPRQATGDKRWRESVDVGSAEGSVEVAGGVPVSADLRARYTFTKDGKGVITADVEYRHRLEQGAQVVTPPTDAVPTPVRRSLEDERRHLLGEEEP